MKLAMIIILAILLEMVFIAVWFGSSITCGGSNSGIIPSCDLRTLSLVLAIITPIIVIIVAGRLR
jgi:hypothetical protein